MNKITLIRGEIAVSGDIDRSLFLRFLYANGATYPYHNNIERIIKKWNKYNYGSIVILPGEGDGSFSLGANYALSTNSTQYGQQFLSTAAYYAALSAAKPAPPLSNSIMVRSMDNLPFKGRVFADHAEIGCQTVSRKQVETLFKLLVADTIHAFTKSHEAVYITKTATVAGYTFNSVTVTNVLTAMNKVRDDQKAS